MELKTWPPLGLADFWQETTFAAESAALDWGEFSQSNQGREGFDIRRIEFRGIDGSAKHGWIARPQDVESPLGMLWLAPYSRWSMKPNEYGTRAGFTSLSFNFHGESAFHEEVYRPERGYFAEGVQSPQTWIFRRMYQDAILASRVLEASGVAKIGASGMSQGGGIAIWMGAFCPRIKAVAAEMPFLGGVSQMLAPDKVYRYPIKELMDAAEGIPGSLTRIAETIRWFDTQHLAAFCQAQTLVSYGVKDAAVRPFQVEAVYEALPGIKTLIELPGGHDWHPEMITHGANWLRQHLAG